MASSAPKTGGGATASFTNTPQAKDDNYTSGQTGLTKNSHRIVYFDVMANDLGGNAKTLWSVDNGINNFGVMDGYSAADLLTQDTARSAATSTDASLNGAKLWVTADSKIGYDTSTLSATFQGKLQALGGGHDATDSFIYSIRLGNGTLSWATATVHFQEINHSPTVTSGAAAAAGAFAELVGVTSSTAIRGASGTITFGDVDLIDVHTVSQTAATFAWSGGVLTGSRTATLAAASSQLLAVQDSTGTGAGSVGWTYKIGDAALDFLAAGETLTVKYDVTVKDNNNATAMQTVTVTVTGSNDLPVITTQDLVGAVIEQVAPAGNLTNSGTIAFTDADLTDRHSISAITASAGALGTLTAAVSTDTTGSGLGGVVTWNYSVANSTVEYLAAGQTKVESFSFNVLDGHGGSVARTVTETVVGTNQAPVITTQGLVGTVTEQAVAPVVAGRVGLAAPVIGQAAPAGDLTNSGTIAFTDADLTDRHSISAITASAGALGTLTAAVSTDTTGSGLGGVVTWNYSVANSTVEYLAAGQTKVESFSFNVLDGHGGSVARTVTETVVGTNQAPVITTADLAGTVTAAPTALVFTVAQYLGFQSNNLTKLQSYAASHAADYTVQTNVIDYTSDPTFAGDSPGNSRWPAAEAQNVNGTTGINNNFFTHITANFSVAASDTYRFQTYNDDGGFLLIDGNVIINDPTYHGETLSTGSTALAGGNHSFELFYFEQNGPASLEFSASDSSGSFGLVGTGGGGMGGPITQVSDSGVINFTDADLTDMHVVSATGTPIGAALGMLTAVIDSDTAGSGTGGQITWKYTVANSAIAYLAAGQTEVESFNLMLDDQHGGVVTKQIDLTVAGTNDAPVVLGPVGDTAAVTEQLPSAGNLSNSGIIAFTDADLTDSHSISAITASAGALGTLTADVTTDTTGSGLGGVVTWNYSVPNSAVEYLAANQTRVDTFSFNVLDGHGGSVARTVTETIKGINDRVMITGGVFTGSVTELPPANSSNLTAGNTFTFKDVDLKDVHSVTVTTPKGSNLGTFNAYLVQESTGTGNGEVAWDFSVANSALGNSNVTHVQDYTVNVLDGRGGGATQHVTVTMLDLLPH